MVPIKGLKGENMRNTKDLTLAGVFIALMTVIAFVPQLGYIQITPVIGVTTMHVPVIIGAILLGRKFGFTLGITFGVLSLGIALTRGATPFELFFLNPFVSILPRAIFGLIIYDLYTFIKKMIKNDAISIGLSAFLSTLIHTTLVLGSIVIIYGQTLNSWDLGNLWVWLIGIVISNGLFEAVFAVVLSIVIIKPIQKLV